ncbi:MaoC/PaaZ C-terminal domain-containing protein [Rhodococcus phenolicus]|uniref:MaoC/PaaZ C-terminal domain-containing protein n=1 Tax=Rhodococcus phenolicus TaxID=263849 RepID=UPI00082C52DA|nr:MaoC/PaaZ C-terminal domain-containing protein [Rhodococcus phenolicus]
MSAPQSLLYAEDLVVGDRIELATHTVGEDELVDFARSWDPQWFHTDRDAAESGPFGSLIASGIHTLAVAQRLTVEAAYGRWAVIAGRRLSQVRFLSPVLPGTTLTGTYVVDDVTLDDRGRGLVVATVTLLDDRGTAVLDGTVESYVRRRG